MNAIEANSRRTDTSSLWRWLSTAILLALAIGCAQDARGVAQKLLEAESNRTLPQQLGISAAALTGAHLAETAIPVVIMPSRPNLDADLELLIADGGSRGRTLHFTVEKDGQYVASIEVTRLKKNKWDAGVFGKFDDAEAALRIMRVRGFPPQSTTLLRVPPRGLTFLAAPVAEKRLLYPLRYDPQSYPSFRVDEPLTLREVAKALRAAHGRVPMLDEADESEPDVESDAGSADEPLFREGGSPDPSGDALRRDDAGRLILPDSSWGRDQFDPRTGPKSKASKTRRE